MVPLLTKLLRSTAPSPSVSEAPSASSLRRLSVFWPPGSAPSKTTCSSVSLAFAPSSIMAPVMPEARVTVADPLPSSESVCSSFTL